uniref:INO80 complex subunit E N-terminal domain-containing protein n=1 Tax=Geospiza parvula TaxID=87175 RepID=A0A8U8BN03_GEOPR
KRQIFQEQECFQEELRRAQRKLLKVSRDKSFLLDRLLQYENVDDDSSDSEATASSDNSDGDGPKGAEPTPPRWPPGGAARPPLPPRPSPRPFLQSGRGLTIAPPSKMASPPYSPFPAQFPPLPPQGGARPRPSPPGAAKGPGGGR